jgi:hypothetical protein
MYDSQSVDMFGKIMFYLCIIFLLVFWLPTEIRILFGDVIIARTLRFDKTNLLFILPAGLALLSAISSSDIDDRWNGIDRNYFASLLWINIMFLRRDKYYMISNKIIKYHDIGSEKIKIKEITEIKETENEIQILGDKKSINISINNILSTDRNILIDKISELNKKVLGTTHNTSHAGRSGWAKWVARK